ncbi:IclR family transcriptional regulator [Nocardia alni]|uniref:IclR family transcriptional regulator n=1 Tax=Nocardia alni TaxID=2815723 RepID=UPI001C244745|nr:IclR family transcriptional regulator [Nocardia alni]
MTLLSVDRTLEIIDILVDRGDVGVSEVAEQLCVAPSTIHRVLETLGRRMYVLQDEDTKRYLPGPRMVAMSDEIDLVARSRRLVEELGESTGMTAHICVLDGPDARYIHHWTPKARRAIGNRVGTRMPAHVTSAGKALLSISTPEQLRKMYPRRALPKPTPAAIGDRQLLLAELQTVRRTGYARNVEESERGVVGFARPVSKARVPVAISVSAWLADLQRGGRDSEWEKRIVDALYAASRELQSVYTRG